jgi:hypothetical protein
MEISSIFSYLILPGKNIENPPQIKGTTVPLSGQTYNLLNDLFQHAESDCDIPICFIVKENEQQRQNEVRTQILNFIRSLSYEDGIELARRLQRVTTKKPGSGLLFVVYGQEAGRKKLMLSRFPADQGIIAEETGRGLEIEFVERVFMKNRNSYKSALYADTSVDSGFWRGLATDKQLNGVEEISQYWIKGFLSSDFFTTSAAGTSRFAKAIKEVSKILQDESQKQELAALSTLLPGLHGQNLSVTQILDRFGTSEEVRNKIVSKLPSAERAGDVFLFDREEFLRNAPYRTLELDNRALITAPTASFDEVIKREPINSEEQIYRIYSEGKITREYLRGR